MLPNPAFDDPDMRSSLNRLLGDASVCLGILGIAEVREQALAGLSKESIFRVG